MKRELIDEIAARVSEKLQQRACPITGQVVSLRKVKDAYENGYRTILVQKNMFITLEAQEYIHDQKITVEITDETAGG